jgi:hypothetical protein
MKQLRNAHGPESESSGKKIAVIVSAVVVVLATIVTLVSTLGRSAEQPFADQMPSQTQSDPQDTYKEPELTRGDPEYVDEDGVKIHKPWEEAKFKLGGAHDLEYTGMYVQYWPAQLMTDDVGYFVHPTGKDFLITEAKPGDMVIPYQVWLTNPEGRNIEMVVFNFAGTILQNPNITVYGSPATDMPKLGTKSNKNVRKYDYSSAKFAGYIVLQSYKTLDDYEVGAIGDRVVFEVGMRDRSTDVLENMDMYLYGLVMKDGALALVELRNDLYGI